MSIGEWLALLMMQLSPVRRGMRYGKYVCLSLQIIATRAGDVEMVSLLVGVAGCDVNKASYVARSRAVHWAASAADCDGSDECLRVLLDAGADVEARVASGRTALVLAARSGHLHAVRLLLRHGDSTTTCSPGPPHYTSL